LAQISGSTRNKSSNKGSWGEVNKSGSIIYRCFVYDFVEHKIYNYPFKDVTQEMFKEKVMIVKTKEDVIVNMVMAIITHSQLLKNVVFKEKEPHKNKNLAN
jgi:hypothetical protein